MKTHKAVILGPQCSGKTTLKQYLRRTLLALPLIEEDALFVELNGGEYPQDIKYKEDILRSKLEDKIREADNMIFLTSYYNPLLLNELKSKGYKIIQLELGEEEFQRRNEKRMKEQGYADANIWAKDVFGFHQHAKNDGLIDKGIDANQPTEDIARQIIEFLE